MIASRCCVLMKNINGFLAIGHGDVRTLCGNVGRVVSRLGAGRVPYSTEKNCNTCSTKCCKCGRNIVDPVEPPNNDPYRIKVSEITVPPLPASTCKWTLLTSGYQEHHQQHQKPSGHPGGEIRHPESQQVQQTEESADKSITAKLKGLLNKIRGKSKGGENMMIISN